MLKIKKYIPNTITSMNLACGVLGVVVCTVFHRMDLAFYLMLAGACCDFCDGLSARALGAYSPMGKELDSLADLISFGLLPSVMLFITLYMNAGTDSCLVFVPLLIAVFSGLRLAKFNVDERQSCSFIGLATPACAMICGSLAYYMQACPDEAFAQACSNIWVIPCISVVLSLLLVSEIPMFSMKIHKGEGMTKDMVLRIIFAAAVLVCVLAVGISGHNWSLIVLCAFIAYILINIISAIFVRRK